MESRPCWNIHQRHVGVRKAEHRSGKIPESKENLKIFLDLFCIFNTSGEIVALRWIDGPGLHQLHPSRRGVPSGRRTGSCNFSIVSTALGMECDRML